MHWDAIGALAQVLAAALAVAGVLQLYELQRGSKLSGFVTVIDILQEEQVRAARKLLVQLAEKPYADWTKEEKEQAELACRKFNAVGIMVRNKMIDPKLLLADWSRAIVDTWEAAKPMTTDYRKQRGSDTWKKFEYLYDLAVKYRRKHKISQSLIKRAKQSIHH